MSKKNENQIGQAVRFEVTPSAERYAAAININLAATAEQRWDALALARNAEQAYFAAQGLLLLSLKKDVEHGAFYSKLTEIGCHPRQASRAMSYARFVFSRSEDEQLELLKLPHTTVCTLAAADPDVIEMAIEDGIENIDAVSVRELYQRNQELKLANVDLQVERDTIEAQRLALQKQLRRRSTDADDAGIPTLVSDLRAETAALVKKAELAINSLHPLGMELGDLRINANAEINQWSEPTQRMALAGLLSLRELTDGAIAAYVHSLGEGVDRLHSRPDALSFMLPAEIDVVAKEWAELTALHSHEAALRQHEREVARPKGKGRPKAAPEAPDVAAKARKA